MKTQSSLPLRVLLWMSVLLLWPAFAASGTQFYVDSRAGDDSHPGTSPRMPWRSLEKVNAAAFAPGDHVRFRAGSVWFSPLIITAQGAAGHPIVFEAYGSGPRPRLEAAGQFTDAITISNAQHVILKDFEVTNKGDVGSGISTGASGMCRHGKRIDQQDSERGSATRSMPAEAWALDNPSLSTAGGACCGSQSRAPEPLVLPIDNGNSQIRPTNTPPRRGVHIVAYNCGTLTNLVVSDLFIHDVNGTQRSKDNGGIIFTTRGDRVPSRFIGLRIERNIIWRVDRSGIVAQSYHARRNRWFPSLDVIIRDNWLGDLGGDGITPWATEGCLVEHNIVQGANERAGTYNAGIWPWSTDHTVMRLNRASGVKTLMDGQGFDSDYNSRHALIEYNLSHDNEGGFLLICTPGSRKAEENCGNFGTVARYNISRHDQARTVHVAGAPRQTRIYRNAFYLAPEADVQLLLLSDWSGWADGLEIKNNLFHSEGVARYGHQISRDYNTGAYGIGPGWGPATNIIVSGNVYLGRHENRPAEGSQNSSTAPKPISFNDWPGPQFDPTHPEKFNQFLQAHRQWMMELMERQFGQRPR